MEITVGDILEIVDKIPREERKKWKGLQFVIEENVLSVEENGLYCAGKWFNGGIITLYSEMIRNKDHLKEVILHEIAHHLGLKHGDLKGIV